MDKELKDKWVVALRSGEYTQTQNRLHDDIGFCCLGVLSEICAFPEWNGEHYLIPEVNAMGEETGDMVLGEDEELPGYILDRIGLTTDQQNFLAQMNDGHGLGEAQSFLEIADYIEANL